MRRGISAPPVLLLAAILILIKGDDALEKLKDKMFGTALQDVHISLTCIQDVLTDSLRVSQKNNNDVNSLNTTVQVQQEKIVSMEKTLLKAITNAVVNLKDEINREGAEDCDAFAKMQQTVADYDHVNEENKQNILKVQRLEGELAATKIKNTDCLSQVSTLQAEREAISKENNNNILKVQDLERKLKESQKRVDVLTQQVTNLTFVVGSQKKEIEENQVKELLQEYGRTKDWETLRRGLEAILDKFSEAYRQLQDIEYRDSSPLFNLGFRGHVDLARVLLSGGLPVDTYDRGGFSMMQGAAEGGKLLVVNVLLDHGAHLETRDSNGRTPLMQAAYFGHLEVVQLLVKAGASTSSRDNDGLRALDLARSERHNGVSEYLTAVAP